MTRLHQLFTEQGQSPWLDNLSRPLLSSGELRHHVERGVRGVTSNPTILQKALSGSGEYDEQMRTLWGAGLDPLATFWELAIEDVRGALDVFRPLYEASTGRDGFVSLELAPDLAHDTPGSERAARELHERINQPNLFVKIPATTEGVRAIRTMIAEGRNINVTLIFGLERYAQVIEAYLAGLETYQGDLSGIHSVASFFVSRVDTALDKQLETIGTGNARELQGKAGVAQAKLAYQLFREQFSGPRWDALAKRGAQVQRPLWASTSTKNPRYPDLLYVDNLIGPDTVNTMPDATIAAFEDHGQIARTIDQGLAEARTALRQLSRVGVDMADVSSTLEREGVDAFAKSFKEAVAAIDVKMAEVSRR
jgi:transaldolase